MKPNTTTITIPISEELKSYLALYGMSTHQSKTAIIHKTVSMSLRRLSKLNPISQLIPRIVLTIDCKWHQAKAKGIPFSDFYVMIVQQLAKKGVAQETIELIMKEFTTNEKKSDKNLSKTGKG